MTRILRTVGLATGLGSSWVSGIKGSSKARVATGSSMVDFSTTIPVPIMGGFVVRVGFIVIKSVGFPERRSDLAIVSETGGGGCSSMNGVSGKVDSASWVGVFKMVCSFLSILLVPNAI